VGGRDEVCGGTWQGINEAGLVASVLNRRAPTAADPRKRSRGLLCLDALRQGGLREALAFVRRHELGAYNPFSLVLTSPTSAYVVQGPPPRREFRRLEPGVYLITNQDLNDPSCPRISRFHRRFAEAAENFRRSPSSLDALFSRVASIMATHAGPRASENGGAGGGAGLCLHLGRRSSSLIAYDPAARRYRFLFAPGPPCREAYREVSALSDEGAAPTPEAG
jgi:uncharacterized protein with NRDE domain